MIFLSTTGNWACPNCGYKKNQPQNQINFSHGRERIKMGWKKKLLIIIICIILLIVGYFGIVIYLLAFHPSSIISIKNESSFQIKSSDLTILSADCCVSGNNCPNNMGKGEVNIKIRWDYSGKGYAGYSGIWEIKLLYDNQTVASDRMNQPLVTNRVTTFQYGLYGVNFTPNREYKISLTEEKDNLTLQTVCYAI